MKKISKLSIVFLVVSALIVGATASYLVGLYRLPVAMGHFGVKVSASTPAGNKDLKVDGSVVSEEIQEFPYIENVQNLQLGEYGHWSDGQITVSQSAHYAFSVGESKAELPLAFRLRVEGPEAEKASEALVTAVEVTGTQDGAREFVVSNETGANWHQEPDGSMVTQEFYFGIINENTTGSLGFAFMSTANEPVNGDYNITIDVCEPATAEVPVTG